MQVPHTVRDEELTDDWQCKDNTWDAAYASCDVPQEMSNDQIDETEMLQVRFACKGRFCMPGLIGNEVMAQQHPAMHQRPHIVRAVRMPNVGWSCDGYVCFMSLHPQQQQHQQLLLLQQQQRQQREAEAAAAEALVADEQFDEGDAEYDDAEG